MYTISDAWLLYTITIDQFTVSLFLFPRFGLLFPGNLSIQGVSSAAVPCRSFFWVVHQSRHSNHFPQQKCKNGRFHPGRGLNISELG